MIHKLAGWLLTAAAVLVAAPALAQEGQQPPR